jgi:hypothetical protein
MKRIVASMTIAAMAAGSMAQTTPTLPGAPVITAVTPGDASATINFIAPPPNDFPVEFIVIDCDDTNIATAPSPYTATVPIQLSPINNSVTINGLPNGQQYSCTIAAQIIDRSRLLPRALTGPESNQSAAFTPSVNASDVPIRTPNLDLAEQQPVDVPAATASDGPSADTVTAPSTPATPVAAPSTPVATAPVAAPVAAPVTKPPGAPRITDVEVVEDGVRLFWSAPSVTGGSQVTGYMVACQPNAQVVASNEAASPKPIELPAGVTTTVVALTPGQAYTCSVSAKNENGSGPAASQTVTYNALVEEEVAEEAAPVVDEVIEDSMVSGAAAAMTSMVVAAVVAFMF